MRDMNFEICWQTKSEGTFSERFTFRVEGSGFVGFTDITRWARGIVTDMNKEVHHSKDKRYLVDVLFVDYPAVEEVPIARWEKSPVVCVPTANELYLAALKAQRLVAMSEADSLPAGSKESLRLRVLCSIIDDLNKEMNTLEAS